MIQSAYYTEMLTIVAFVFTAQSYRQALKRLRYLQEYSQYRHKQVEKIKEQEQMARFVATKASKGPVDGCQKRTTNKPRVNKARTKSLRTRKEDAKQSFKFVKTKRETIKKRIV